jgi:uncharacterized membrane protein YdbT with pleckstrin-like domain
MLCSVCGAQIGDGSRFCNKCGAVVTATAPQAAISTRPSARMEGTRTGTIAERPTDAPEQVVFSIRPALLFVGLAYTAAALVWIVLTALVAAITAQFDLGQGPGAVAVVLIGLVLFAYPALLHLRRQRHRYTLTNYKLEIQTGILARTTRNVLLSKIQDVTVASTILKRLVGIGDVVIETAGEAGRITLKNVPNAKRNADILLRELQRWN